MKGVQGICGIWILSAIFLFLPFAVVGEDKKGSDEDREIIENLDALEIYEMLRDMDILLNYEMLEKEEGSEIKP